MYYAIISLSLSPTLPLLSLSLPLSSISASLPPSPFPLLPFPSLSPSPSPSLLYISLSDPTKGRITQMSSFVESKMERFVKNKDHARNFVIYSRMKMSRVYPNGRRLESTNYDPTPMWCAGSQLVALNYQTPGE